MMPVATLQATIDMFRVAFGKNNRAVNSVVGWRLELTWETKLRVADKSLKEVVENR